MMKRAMVVCLAAALLAPAARSEEAVLYAVTVGAMQGRPVVSKTEIFAAGAQGSPRLVYSDANADFLLLTSSRQSGWMASARGRIFALGFGRKNYTGGWPTFPAVVYELSSPPRKLFDIEGENGSSNFRNLFADPLGSKVAYLNYLSGKLVLTIHDTAKGTVLNKVDLSATALDCFVTAIGWTPDGHRIFFTLETGDEHVTSAASYRRAGSYAMNEDGSGIAPLPREITGHPKRPGSTADDTVPALLGMLPDGRYVFHEFQWSPGGRKAVHFVYALDPRTKARQDFPGVPQEDPRAFSLSPGGELAIIAADTVYVLDLKTGAWRKVFTIASRPPALPWLNLVGWQ
jgi:hypothetical protein